MITKMVDKKYSLLKSTFNFCCNKTSKKSRNHAMLLGYKFKFSDKKS